MKIRIKITTVVEFEPNPEHYPEGFTSEQMLALELNTAQEDESVFWYHSNAKHQLEGEILP